MSALISSLRGPKLRDHLQALSLKYNWCSLGTSVEVGPKSVTKRDRRRPPRRESIAQTPVRQLYSAAPSTAIEAPQSRVFATKAKSFLATLNDDSSSASPSSSDDDGSEVENSNSELDHLTHSLDRLGIIEYIPALTRPALGVLDSNSSMPRPVSAGKKKSKAPVASAANNAAAKRSDGFKKQRSQLALQLFLEYNESVFGSQLPSDLSIRWNKRLLTTAGITKLRLVNQKRVAAVELSEKVVDDMARLKTTILHELCHAAAWIVDAERRPPHGRCFWKWANTASAIIPDANITTCHSYIIHKPFKYKCTNSECNVEYNRHSKSIDTDKHRCGSCTSELEFVGKCDIAGTPVVKKSTAAGGGFAGFVKLHFAEVKEQLNSPRTKRARGGGPAPHVEVMRALSAKYYEEKGVADIKTPVFIDL